jgi:hypothetical protein
MFVHSISTRIVKLYIIRVKIMLATPTRSVCSVMVVISSSSSYFWPRYEFVKIWIESTSSSTSLHCDRAIYVYSLSKW